MPAVNVTTWFLMVTAILSVLARLGTKYRIFRKWTVDDYLSIASLVCIPMGKGRCDRADGSE